MADDGDAVATWSQLKNSTAARKLEHFAAGEGSTASKGGVRAAMNTPDRQKRTDDWERTPKVRAKEGYFTSSDEDEEAKPPSLPAPRAESPGRHSAGGKSPADKKKKHRRGKHATVVPTGAPGDGPLSTTWLAGEEPEEEETAFLRSLKAVNADESVVRELETLESKLEATGATAKLRQVKNTELRQQQLERDALTLGKNAVPPPDFGRIKRVEWQLPSEAQTTHFLDDSQPRVFGSTPTAKHPLYDTLTGRFCFVTGYCGVLGKCDPCCEGTASQLDVYGLQVSWYFKFLKLLMWTMAGALLVAIPNLLLFKDGTRYSDGDGADARPSALGGSVDAKREWAAYSLGNLLRPTNETLYELPLLGSTASATDTTSFVVGFAVLGAVFMLVVAVYMHYMAKDLSARSTVNTGGTVSVEQFSVAVTNLPKNVTHDEMVGFFERATGQRVEEVELAEDHEKLISMLCRRTSLATRIMLLDGLIRYKNTQARKAGRVAPKLDKQLDDPDIDEEEFYRAKEANPDPGKTKGLVKQRVKLIQRLNLLLHKMEGRDYAFQQNKKMGARVGDGDNVELPSYGLFKAKQPVVAFVTFASQAGQRACLAAYPPGLFRHLMMPSELRLRGHRLKVGYSTPNQLVRKCITMLAPLLVWVLLFVALVAGRRMEWSGFTHGDLDGLLPSSAVKPCPAEDPVPSLSPAALAALDNSTLLPSVHCLCSWQSFAGAPNLEDVCGGWETATLLQLVSPALVVLANLLLAVVMRFLTPFEKHHSVAHLELSLYHRLWAAQLLTTVVGVIAANANFEKLLGADDFGEGLHDVDWAWFRDVGTDFLYIVVLSAVLPIIVSLLAVCVRAAYLRARTRWCCRFSSQHAMEASYQPPPFGLAERWAYMSTLLWTCLLFGAGVPLLYAACAVAMAALYVRDKVLFLRVTATPVLTDARLFQALVSWMWWGVAAHAGLAAWMLGNPEFLYMDRGRVWSSVADADEEPGALFGRSYQDIVERLFATPALVLTAVSLLVGVGVVAVGAVRVIVLGCRLFVCPKAATVDLFKPWLRPPVLGSQCWFTKAKCAACTMRCKECAVRRYRRLFPLPKERPWESSDEEEDTKTGRIGAAAPAVSPGAVDVGEDKEAGEDKEDTRSPRPSQTVDVTGVPLPLRQALEEGKVLGLLSYSIIDNPKYRDAFPFAEQDFAKVRRIGIARAALLKTLSPEQQNPVVRNPRLAPERRKAAKRRK